MLLVKDFSYTYPESESAAVSGISMHVNAGECVCLTGQSGSGKSTLLLAIKGMLRNGAVSGAIVVDVPEDSSDWDRDKVGLVFQNAETQILCSTVAEEVAFGPENLCVSPQEIGRRVEKSLESVRLEGFWDRNVERMSAGQKHRLAIASVLSMNPGLILLDEPTSQLDATGKSELVEVLKKLKQQGYALLVVEHNLEPFRDLIDRYLLLENGRIVAASCHAPTAFIPPEKPNSGQISIRDIDANEPVIYIENLNLSYPGTGRVLKDIQISISRASLVHLFGKNGAGKSSLLRCLAGALKADSGTIRTAGIKISRQNGLFGKVGFLFQNPQRQLFENTVHDEVGFALKRMKLLPIELQRRVMEALEICESAHLANRLPLSLSFGEQHRVALASVLAPKPEILLLDEPFAGLDVLQRFRLLNILADLRDKYGTTILIASHDPLPDPTWADQTIIMEYGEIV
ncbi:MAG TPA: ATP-binding cassette domain-containing protein [Geobacteraceae bacterium]|nr:ATP-binding cassette domain-containing protein [Geobacteraceae bacterium]